MAYKFFYIPALWPADAEAELNAFLTRHTVQTVDRQFISAGEQTVPSYAVFSNERLAAMVTRRVRTFADLRTIDGIAQARCERYVEAFLKLLASLQSSLVPKLHLGNLSLGSSSFQNATAT